MSDEMNVERMDEYEITYQKYKKQWDTHYRKVRDFITTNKPEDIKKWGFVGVTNTIPEIDSSLLKYVDKLVLLDINEKSMVSAKEYIEKEYFFKKIDYVKKPRTIQTIGRNF